MVIPIHDFFYINQGLLMLYKNVNEKKNKERENYRFDNFLIIKIIFFYIK